MSDGEDPNEAPWAIRLKKQMRLTAMTHLIHELGTDEELDTALAAQVAVAKRIMEKIGC